MKTINFDSLLDYLKINNIAFKVFREEFLIEEYSISSIFSPIDKGFYFFVGDNFSLEIKNSLILTDKEFDTKNSLLIVNNIDPQLLFYRILNHFFGEKSTGIISPTSVIHKDAKIGKNVQIDSFCEIGNSIIADNVIIGSHCRIYDNVKIDENTIIEPGSIIGTSGIAWAWNEDKSKKIRQPQLGGVHIGKNCMLAANTIVVRGSLNDDTIIGENSFLAPGCRLGHGTQIGKYVHLANAIVTGGNAIIGDYSFLGSGVVIRPRTKIDKNTVIGAGSVVIKDTTKSGLTLMGVPAKEFETKNKLRGMPKPKKE